MKISTKGRYALRLMLDLAENAPESYVSLRDISERQNISVKYSEQIVSLLCKRGLLKSSRGAQGGYMLTKRPSEYTVGEILRVTEGNLAPIACLRDAPNRCERYATCGTIGFWEGLYETIRAYTDRYTLEDLLREQQQKAGNACKNHNGKEGI